MDNKRYYFLHPKTLKVCDIYNGRSIWEDHIDKEEFIVVKEVGPSFDHYKEACAASERPMVYVVFSYNIDEPYTRKTERIFATEDLAQDFIKKANNPKPVYLRDEDFVETRIRYAWEKRQVE
ncbi:hypothetical protein CCP1ISM_3740001 [Azospirillaceae bacterium]